MKLIYKVLSILFASAAMQSCNLMGSIDDIKPEHVVDDESAIVDAATAQMELSGVYTGFFTYEVGIFRTCMSTWAGTLGSSNTAGINDFLGNSKNESDIKIENHAVEGVYLGYYYIINSANSFIANLERSKPSDLSEMRKNEMLAEARCLRALVNIHLLRLFGEFYDTNSEYGVVLYEEPVRANEPKARSKVSDCYELILEDLEFAADNAPAMPEMHSVVSSLFAKALMARVYLTLGDYPQASIWADRVIDEAENCGYSLEGDFLSVFDSQFESPEMLFAPYVSMASSELIGSNWSNSKAGRLMIALGNPLGEEDVLDPRYQATFMDVDNLNQINKYPKLQNYTDLNSYYFMRLPEVYYIKAEAEARLGHYDEARECLRPFCDRSGYAEDYVDNIADEDMLGMVLKNKILELGIENGEEWFDLVRYHKLGGFEGWTDSEKAKLPAFNQLLLPIPRMAMSGNTSLVQNPQY